MSDGADAAVRLFLHIRRMCTEHLSRRIFSLPNAAPTMLNRSPLRSDAGPARSGPPLAAEDLARLFAGRGCGGGDSGPVVSVAADNGGQFQKSQVRPSRCWGRSTALLSTLKDAETGPARLPAHRRRGLFGALYGREGRTARGISGHARPVCRPSGREQPYRLARTARGSEDGRTRGDHRAAAGGQGRRSPRSRAHRPRQDLHGPHSRRSRRSGERGTAAGGAARSGVAEFRRRLARGDAGRIRNFADSDCILRADGVPGTSASGSSIPGFARDKWA